MPRVLLTVVAVLLSAVALAAERPPLSLAERLTPEVRATVWPGDARIGPAEGTPPAAPVFVGEELAGYIFSTLDVVRASGYSGVPFDVIAGVDLTGTITGARVVFHAEPILEGDPIRQPKLKTFLDAHRSFHLFGANPGALPPDFVAGASISSNSMRAAIVDAATIILGLRLPRAVVTKPTLDLDVFRPASWSELVAAESVARINLSNAAAARLFSAAGARFTPEGAAETNFVELYAALGTPPTIGRNLLGRRAHNNNLELVPAGGTAIIIATGGTFDFLGKDYQRAEDDYVFPRLRVMQGGRSFTFDKAHFERIGTNGSDGIRALTAAGWFTLDADAGFDPLVPWTVEIALDEAGTVKRALDYVLPAEHILLPPVPRRPAWMQAWIDARGALALLGAALVALTLILVFQARLTQRRLWHRVTRKGFLLFTLVGIGWGLGAQLSILHLANYLQAPLRHLDLGFYLMEPLIVVIAAYALLSLPLLGRGVFCGWLCPFGALQELTAQLGQVLRLPQWAPGERAAWWLSWGKYVSAVAVLGATLYSPAWGAAASEVEPFKTAITSGFMRAWPFAAYAGVLVLTSLFVERAYCRFLCPLGGTLAALGHFHALDPLKRRAECGKPCRLCERACPVKAIERSGRIDADECFLCLDCQVEYADPARCPPLKATRQTRLASIA